MPARKQGIQPSLAGNVGGRNAAESRPSSLHSDEVSIIVNLIGFNASLLDSLLKVKLAKPINRLSVTTGAKPVLFDIGLVGTAIAVQGGGAQ